MHISIRAVVAGGLGILAIGAIAFAPQQFAGPSRARALTNCSVDSAALDPEEAQMLTMINNYRAANGLVPLATSSNLQRAATWMAADLGNKRYFDHTDSLGRTPSQRARDCGYPADAGENIAGGTLWSGPQDVFDTWRNSPGHNENLLNAPYRKIGIARVNVPGSPYTWYWVTDFGFAEDGTTADLPFAGPEYGVRGSEVTPGQWNVVSGIL